MKNKRRFLISMNEDGSIALEAADPDTNEVIPAPILVDESAPTSVDVPPSPSANVESAAPIVTDSAPVVTTEAPVSEPVVTTEAPVSEPVVTTEAPVSEPVVTSVSVSCPFCGHSLTLS
jgi:hypothetical protein